MNEEYIKLLVKDCVIDDDNIYCISSECNMLFAQNMESGEITIIDSIPENICVERDALGAVCKYKNEIYIAPNKNEKIWIYNIDTNEWLSIERKRLDCNGFGGMLQTFVHEDIIYMVGAHYPAIIAIDPITKSVKYIEEPFFVKGDSRNLSDIYFRTQGKVLNDILYLPSCIDNTVLKFNLKNFKYEWINVGEISNCFSGITYDGDSFWLSPRCNSSIVKWNGGDYVEEIKLPTRFAKSDCYFCGILSSINEVSVCNMISKDSLRVDKRTLRLTEDVNQYIMVKEINELTVIQDACGNLKIFEHGKLIYESLLQIERRKLYKHFDKSGLSVFDPENITQENHMCTLNGFIDFVLGD